MMSENVSALDRLRALVTQWRELLKQDSIECPDCEGVMRRCADELDAALAVVQAPQPVRRLCGECERRIAEHVEAGTGPTAHERVW